jgi:hypothetical protein
MIRIFTKKQLTEHDAEIARVNRIIARQEPKEIASASAETIAELVKRDKPLKGLKTGDILVEEPVNGASFHGLSKPVVYVRPATKYEIENHGRIGTKSDALVMVELDEERSHSTVIDTRHFRFYGEDFSARQKKIEKKPRKPRTPKAPAEAPVIEKKPRKPRTPKAPKA